MDKEQKSLDSIEEKSGKTESRRKFIKKASIGGATLTTLSAQSVWGACTVSGALSGGSQHNLQDDCFVPGFVNNGRSGGTWKNAAVKGNKICSIFQKIKCSHKSDKGDRYQNYLCIRADLKSTLDTPVALDNKGTTFDLKAALNHGGIQKHIAAAYFNAKYELHPLPNGISSPEHLVIHLLGLSAYLSKINSATNLSSILKATHTDGKTDYTIFDCLKPGAIKS